MLNLVFLSAYYSAAKWTFIWDTEADSNRINLITGDMYWYSHILINNMQSTAVFCSLAILNNAYSGYATCMHTDQTISII